MERLTRRAALLGSAAVAGGLAGCGRLGGGGLEVTSLEIDADGLAKGTPATIRATVENGGSSTTTEPLALTVDGTEIVREAITVEAGSSRVWELGYVPRTSGSVTVAVNGVSQDVSVADGPLAEREPSVRGIAAEREYSSSGIVEVALLVENPHDEAVYAAPLVAVDGMRAAVETRTGGAGDSERGLPVRIPAGETRSLIARRVVPADGEYPAAVDGERVGVADLELRETPYQLGTASRTGPRMPSGGIGTEPRLVAEFSYTVSNRVSEGAELVDITLQAVSEDRLYLSTRWQGDSLLGSMTALDRWSGEELWTELVVPGSEVAAVDGTEYLLAATSPEQMVLIAGDRNETEQWRRELDLPRQRWAGTNLVPAGDSLYVTTAGGVAEIERESGETRRTLPGAFAMVGDEAVFTFGGEGPLAKFPQDGETTTPEWERTPLDGTLEVGAVANGVAYTSAFSGGDVSDYEYQFHAYDVDSGERLWETVASRSAATAVGVRLPGLPELTVRNGYVMWSGGGNIVEAETGQRVRTDGIRAGRAAEPLRPRRVYGVDSEEFFVTSFFSERQFGDRPIPGENAVALPEPLGESLRADMLYGHGVVYVATANGVYGYSATLPSETE